MATSSRIAPVRGDAPPFDFKQFTRDVVVPSDQALVLDKLPGWFRAGGVRMRDDVLIRSRSRARRSHDVVCAFSITVTNLRYVIVDVERGADRRHTRGI